MEDVLIPICVCVVLPIAIVLINALSKINGENRRTQVIIKAIEANKDVDTDRLIESLRVPRRSERETLNRRLLWGCMFSLVGLVLMLLGLVNLLSGTPISEDPVAVPMVFGGISIAIGLSFLIVCHITGKQLRDMPEDTSDR